MELRVLPFGSKKSSVRLPLKFPSNPLINPRNSSGIVTAMSRDLKPTEMVRPIPGRRPSLMLNCTKRNYTIGFLCINEVPKTDIDRSRNKDIKAKRIVDSYKTTLNTE